MPATRMTSAAGIARTLSAKGQSVTLTPIGAVTYDPSSASVTATGTPQTVKAVLLPIGGNRHVPGETVALGNVQCFLSALDIAGAAVSPAVDDALTDARGNGYVVSAVATLAPAGVPLMHELVLRGAA